MIVLPPPPFLSLFCQENLTDALADLDAALEKEFHRASESAENEDGSSKVEELEKQCKSLESELENVKGCIYFRPCSI